jgi:prepilin-type N-terminal cleavage/methylation domain-containing protein
VKRAFTLLELAVVLAIIAIVTHFAVRGLGEYRNAKFADAADRQLETIREAALKFYSDVGRLPKLTAQTNDAGEVSWTLSELWKKPDGLSACRHVEHDGVHLAVGWNGPYLKLPFGRDRLLDPWGNAIELEDGAGLRRLWADENNIVTNVCHYGASGQENCRKSVSLVPDGGGAASLIVTVDAGAYSGPVECVWYGAYENSVTNETVSLPTAGGQVVFKDVPCGRKTLKVAAGRTSVHIVDVRSPVTQTEIKVQ